MRNFWEMAKPDKSTIALLLLTLGFLGFIFFGVSSPKIAIPVDPVLVFNPGSPLVSGLVPDPDWHELLEDRCNELLHSSEESKQAMARLTVSELETLLEKDIALMRANVD